MRCIFSAMPPLLCFSVMAMTGRVWYLTVWLQCCSPVKVLVGGSASSRRHCRLDINNHTWNRSRTDYNQRIVTPVKPTQESRNVFFCPFCLGWLWRKAYKMWLFRFSLKRIKTSCSHFAPYPSLSYTMASRDAATAVIILAVLITACQSVIDLAPDLCVNV